MPLIYAGQRVTANELSLNYTASDIGVVTVTASSLTDLTASFTVPANDSAVGNLYDIEAWGNGVQGSTLQTLTFQVVYGGNNMSTFTIGSTAWSSTSQAFRWHMTARVICLSTGPTGSFQSLIFGELSAFGSNLIPSNSSNITGAFISCESSSSTTIDTTSAQGLKLQCNWGSTTGAPTITKRVAIQRKLGLG